MPTRTHDHFSNLDHQERTLREAIAKNFSPDDAHTTLEALAFAKHAHEKQFRDEGAPYIIHPVRISLTLFELKKATAARVCAALLHDVVEDTGIPLEEIVRRFGKRVGVLVDNLTRLRPLHETEEQKKRSKIEKFTRYLSADYDTRLIKCGDILDNVRSWTYIPKEHPSRKKFSRWYSEVKQYSLPLAEKTDSTLAAAIRESYLTAREE